MGVQGQGAGELAAAQQTTQPQLQGLKHAPLATGESTLSHKIAFRAKAWYQLGQMIMSSYASTMLDLDVKWQAPLSVGPKILAANHPTTTDPLYLLSLLTEPVSFLITAACFDIPVVGGYLRAAGHLPAIRGSRGATVEAMVHQIESGRSVALFPEGALSPLDGGFHRPRSGLARVILRTGAPLIPIGIGLRRDRIRVAAAQIDGDRATGHFYLSGPYAITVGRPMTFQGDVQDHQQVRAVADQVMHRIRDLARESEVRIRQAQAPVSAPQPGARPAEAL